MPQFNKRRNRIRASDKSLVFRFSAGSLLLLFLAVVMLLNLKTIITTDWKVISLFQDGSVHLTVTPYRIMTIVLAALVCVLASVPVYLQYWYLGICLSAYRHDDFLAGAIHHLCHVPADYRHRTSTLEDLRKMMEEE